MLGAKILDGRGQLLAFGGQVMKNVAGYDVSRLLAGSLGTLGLIVEVSLKLLPRPPEELTLKFEMPQAKALESLRRWAGRPLPISASAWRDGELRAAPVGRRERGALGCARPRRRKPAGGRGRAFLDRYSRADGSRFSRATRRSGACRCLRRRPRSTSPGAQLLEWGGALRWLRAGEHAATDAAAVREAASRAGGHATLFRAAQKPQGAFAPLPPLLARLHRDLKRAFDPAGILNPGRLYAEF